MKKAVTALTIVGAHVAPPKTGATDPIPSNGLPSDPVDRDSSWISQGFIPSLRRLHPDDEPVADVTKATFLMTLPENTEWHALAPWQAEVQKCTWQFADEDTLLAVPGIQALTDVVGFSLIVPDTTELWVTTGNQTQNIAVNFGATRQFPIALTAGPKTAKPPKQNEPVEHFRHLYHLSDPNRPDIMVPVCLCAMPDRADDIFCPGGEGEGEGGG